MTAFRRFLPLALLALAVLPLRADGVPGFVQILGENPLDKIREKMPKPVMDMTIHLVDSRTNAPIPGAEVRVVCAHGSARTVSNDEGEVVAGMMQKETTYMTITAKHPLYVPTRARWYVKDGEFPIPEETILALEPGVTIGGQIVNDQGEPVSKAKVTLRLAERSSSQQGELPVVDAHLWRDSVETDDAGRWSYPRAPRDLRELNIKVTHPMYVEKEINYPDIVLQEKGPALFAQQDVIMLETGAVVAGRVVGPDGQAVPNADVKIRAPRIGNVKAAITTTDAQGRFFFPAVANGTLTLMADAKGEGPGLIRYELEGTAPLLTVPLEKPQRVFGRVIDPSGDPVPGAMISMELWRGTVDITPVAVTDHDGFFSWDQAPTDQAMFRISKNGFISSRVPLVINEDQEIILSAKRIVRGEVTDAATGQPVHTFEILLGTPDADGTVVWFQTQPLIFGYGKYRINLDVPSDNLVIGVRAAGYRPAESRVISEPMVIEKVHFELQPE